MSLLEPEEDASEIGFDEKSKIRLFETQQRESAGGYDYLKKFLPVAVVAIIVVGGIIYFMQPGTGDVVKVQKEAEDAVYEYMQAKEHRSVRESTFYKCDGYYWVRIIAEPRSQLASVDDPANQFRLKVDRAGEKLFNIQTLPLPAKQDDVPCKTN